MVDTPLGQGNGSGGGVPARSPARSSLSAEERNALARNIFAQLKEPPKDDGATPASAAGGRMQTPVAVPPATFGGIRVVGPAAQAQAAQAAQNQAAQAARNQAAQTAQNQVAQAVRNQAAQAAQNQVAQAIRNQAAQNQAGQAKPQAPGRAATAGRPAAGPGAGGAPARTRLRFRLLPVTIFLLVLMLGLRVGDSWRVLTRGGSLPDVSAVVAQTPPAPGKDAGKDAPKDAKEPGKEGKEPGKEPAKEGGKDAAKDEAAAKEAETAAMLLGRPARPDTIDLELVKHLTERREELTRRGRDMEQREALIAAGEKRLDQKLVELQGVRAEIQNLLKQVDDKQRAQIESLVRIYENMKPKDAARIFEALEMPVLMEVVERMKEAKTAPVLAAMDPIKAKDLTTALAERRRVPAVPQ